MKRPGGNNGMGENRKERVFIKKEREGRRRGRGREKKLSGRNIQ